MCLRQQACNTQEHVQAKLWLQDSPARAPVHVPACSRIICHLYNMQQSTSLFGQPFGQILGSIQSLQPVTLVLLNGCKEADDLFLCCFLNNECVEILGKTGAIYCVSQNTSQSSYALMILPTLLGSQME